MASEVGGSGVRGPGFAERGVCLLELVFSAGQGCLSEIGFYFCKSARCSGHFILGACIVCCLYIYDIKCLDVAGSVDGRGAVWMWFALSVGPVLLGVAMLGCGEVLLLIFGIVWLWLILHCRRMRGLIHN